jgi:hypothetical protein
MARTARIELGGCVSLDTFSKIAELPRGLLIRKGWEIKMADFTIPDFNFRL